MPPRSAKKVPVKKPSPRARKTVATPKVDEEVLPSVTEAEEQPVAAEEEKAQVEQKPVEEKAVESTPEEKVVEPTPAEPEPPAAEEAARSAPEEGKDAANENAEDPKGSDLEEPEEEEEDENMEDQEEAEEGDDEPEEEDEGAGTAEQDEADESESDGEANELEEEVSLDADNQTESKKRKDLEIFVGGLNKQTTEEELMKVFGAYGEVESARVVKTASSNRSKGFAFIRYVNVVEAKKALDELKDGIEIDGKKVGVSTSMDNNSLYVGNICKTWTKTQLLEALKGYGIEPTDDIHLPEDPKEEGKILGYAFLEFRSHAEATEALRRLKQPDAVLGCDRSARVAFGRSPNNVSEEALSQVKTVYLDGIPSSWGEEKVKEVCKQYGEIEKVQLSRNFSKKKRKDFGFVAFSSRESALACIEGIKTAEIGEGDVKIKANLAKPVTRSRFTRKAAGGFRVNTGDKDEADQSKKNGENKGTPGKGKAVKKNVATKGNKPSRFPGNQRNQKNASPAAGKRKGKVLDTDTRPFKKSRQGNAYGRPSRYGPPPASYRAHAYGGPSRPAYHSTDMEPHAGLVPGGKQGNPYGYGHSRHDYQPRSGAPYASGPGRHYPYAAPPSHTGYEGGYPYPGSGSYPPAYHRPYY